MFVSYKQSLGYKDNKWSAYQKMTTSKLSLPGLRRGLRSWKKEVDSGEGHKSIHTYRIYRGKVAGWHLQKTAARNGAKRHQDGHWLNISMWCLFCICWCISSTYGTCFPVKPLPLVQSQCLLVKSDKSACVLVESPCLLIRSPHLQVESPCAVSITTFLSQSPLFPSRSLFLSEWNLHAWVAHILSAVNSTIQGKPLPWQPSPQCDVILLVVTFCGWTVVSVVW